MSGWNVIKLNNSINLVKQSLFLVCWLLALALPDSVWAQFDYTINNGAATITGYTGSGGAVTIPSSINGYPVTGVGDMAFFKSTNLTSVTVPNSATSIGGYAFFLCTSLANVTIPNGVTTIGTYAFWRCDSLPSVTIPKSVTTIGDRAFTECTNLTEIMVAAQNPAYSSVGGVLYDKSQTTLIVCPAGIVGTHTIPNSVTSIKDYSFYHCDSLTNVTIGNSVTSIGEGAFWVCTSLTNVTLPNSVTSIGYGAFYACTKLRNLLFQGNAPSLGDDVFIGVNPAAVVYYYVGTTGWGATYGGLPTMMLNLPLVFVTTNGGFGFTNRQFVLTLTGPTGSNVVISASTNLQSWVPLLTNQLSGGTLRFTDAFATNYLRRFYRAKVQ